MEDYRGDVDGLRGLAVLSVVVYHIKPALLPGGFLGVTIFFVLSGYLMGGIVDRAIESGTFAFGKFYARRAARISPALVFVSVVTLALVAVTDVPRARGECSSSSCHVVP